MTSVLSIVTFFESIKFEKSDMNESGSDKKEVSLTSGTTRYKKC